MDITQILADMRLEQERLEEAILALERLAAGGAKRRGRPPAWMVRLKEETSERPRRGGPPGRKKEKAEA